MLQQHGMDVETVKYNARLKFLGFRANGKSSFSNTNYKVQKSQSNTQKSENQIS